MLAKRNGKASSMIALALAGLPGSFFTLFAEYLVGFGLVQWSAVRVLYAFIKFFPPIAELWGGMVDLFTERYHGAKLTTRQKIWVGAVTLSLYEIPIYLISCGVVSLVSTAGAPVEPVRLKQMLLMCGWYVFSNTVTGWLYVDTLGWVRRFLDALKSFMNDRSKPPESRLQ